MTSFGPGRHHDPGQPTTYIPRHVDPPKRNRRRDVLRRLWWTAACLVVAGLAIGLVCGAIFVAAATGVQGP